MAKLKKLIQAVSLTKLLAASLAVVVCLVFFPPKFIGDYNVKVAIFLMTCICFACSGVFVVKSVQNSHQRYIFLILLAILFPVTVVRSLSQISSWCCVSEPDFERLCSLAVRTTEALDKHNIPYWICWGSLLGAVREGSMPFQAVPWEHDFDICVLEKDWAEVTTTLSQTDSIIFDEAKKVVYDTNFRTTMARAYVDVYKYALSEDKEWLETHEGSHDIKRTRVSTIEPLSSIQVCNRQFKAPKDPQQAVKDIYGGGFMEPRWPPGLTGLTCKLYQDCVIPNPPVR